MSVISGMFDRSQVRFHHGKPVSGPRFTQCVEESHVSTRRWHPQNIDVVFSRGVPKINLLVLSGHCPDALLCVLEKYFQDHRSDSLLQRHALQQFLTTKEKQLKSRAPLESKSIFKTYYDALDTIFFFGSLKDLCKISICPPRSLGRNRVGQFINFGVTGRDGYAGLIELEDTTERFVDPGVHTRKWRVHDYIETLLHEMLHAYFDIFACICHARCERRKKRALGTSGHGTAWQWAALAIEEKSGDLFFKKFDMCREPSWNLESAAYRDGAVHRQTWGFEK
ncbi:hypothetical protein B2J93_2453 [Marssonina coronariae]|uniref:SprT-like domain-containing protein n=1 Tax=Diplocarpon coronariae TaxID=2795749 RepID=A0A218YTQ5_9HELO|nr:hypothetical protein B2J93_2453 [Marssonina coronariae]